MKSLRHSRRRPKQTVLEKRESRRSRGAADGCERGFLSQHDFSTPLLSLFPSSLSSLFFHQFALFALLSKPRLARRFYLLLLLPLSSNQWSLLSVNCGIDRGFLDGAPGFSTELLPRRQ